MDYDVAQFGKKDIGKEMPIFLRIYFYNCVRAEERKFQKLHLKFVRDFDLFVGPSVSNDQKLVLNGEVRFLKKTM